MEDELRTGLPFSMADGEFSPALGTRTERDCHEPEGVIDQAEAYFSTLMRMDRFRVSGDRLELLIVAARPGWSSSGRRPCRAIPLTCRGPGGGYWIKAIRVWRPCPSSITG